MLDGRRRPRRAPARRPGRRGRRAGAGSRSRSRCARSATARSASTSPPSRRLAPDLPWPDADGVGGRGRRVAAGSRPACVRLEHGLLYLDRYHRLERQVCDDLLARTAQPPPGSTRRALDAPRVARVARRPLQRRAARPRRSRAVPAVDDGPHRRARHRQDHHRRPAARAARRPGADAAAAVDRARRADRQGRGAAPGGGRRAELRRPAPEDRDRVGRVEAMTLHRLLGWRPDNATRFRHDRGNRLKYDVVVVDESSMVELTMMARLLEAVRPQARLVLVGDPRQLTSVGAGAVLSDLVAGYDGDPALRSSRSPRTTASDRGHQDARRGAARRRRRRRARRAAGGRRPGRVRRDRRARRAALRADAVAPALRGPRRGRGRRRRGGGRGARRAPAALRPPRGPARRTPLEPAGRALARRGDRPRDLRRVVRRPAAAGHHQRLRAATIYNGETGVVVLGDDGRLRAWIAGVRAAARLRARPARRGRDDARDDHPQEPGQPGRAGSPCCCPRRAPGC